MFNVHDKYWIFTHSLNEHIYLLASKYVLITLFKMYSDGNVFKIRGVCFKVISNDKSEFKCNIFLSKILADAPLRTGIDLNLQRRLSEGVKNSQEYIDAQDTRHMFRDY